VRAENFGNSGARLRHEIAGFEVVVLLGSKSPALGGGGIASQPQAERGVADRAGDHHAVARLGAGATHHPALRHRADNCD
jgi:hypothetical protein